MPPLSPLTLDTGHWLTILIAAAGFIGSYVKFARENEKLKTLLEEHIKQPGHAGQLERWSEIEKQLAVVVTDLQWIRNALQKEK
jgi:hypothetical protein